MGNIVCLKIAQQKNRAHALLARNTELKLSASGHTERYPTPFRSLRGREHDTKLIDPDFYYHQILIKTADLIDLKNCNKRESHDRYPCSFFNNQIFANLFLQDESHVILYLFEGSL